MNLQRARTIVAAALAHRAAAGMKPLCVAVLDAGGHLVAFEREDGVPNRRFDIAHGKAYGAISLGASSRVLGTMAVERPHFIAGATAAIGGALVPVAGGVLVVEDGRIIGAVGVSGDTSDNDEAAAIAGVQAAGLTAQ
ncbi:MAG: heme-binding protein [Acidobacteria bacterium]|nr:heme-binding protein [Acidobacteriota bacterium]